MPLMPVLQAQGIGIDMNKVLDKIATYEDQPDLNEIIALPQDEMRDIVARFNAAGPNSGRGNRGGPPAPAAAPTGPTLSSASALRRR